MQQPTVMVLMGEPGRQSAIAFEEPGETGLGTQYRGEILETVVFTHDGQPDWTEASICDHRGGGGEQGYAHLHEALTLLEKNARAIGFEIVRVPRERGHDEMTNFGNEVRQATRTDEEALDELNLMLSAPEWPGASGMEDVCEVVRSTGRTEVPNAPEWHRH